MTEGWEGRQGLGEYERGLAGSWGVDAHSCRGHVGGVPPPPAGTPSALLPGLVFALVPRDRSLPNPCTYVPFKPLFLLLSFSLHHILPTIALTIAHISLCMH